MAKETRPDELAATEVAGVGRADATTAPRVLLDGAALTSEPRVVGRFRIDATLGSGGMGDVYRAYDPVLDRAVALKVLRSEHSSDGAQRMRRVVREARAAAALTHPNTVTIFEVGESESEVFIAMELLEGEDLRSVLDRGDASLPDKLRWLLESARALAAAHERGLVHRDVKPENMFVCRGGALKLLDFGIAKRDDDDAPPAAEAANSVGPSSLRTEAGRRFGTPRYMAPEQHASEATDPRTDQYAWGLVAFELLTGAHAGAELVTVTRETSDSAANQPLFPERLAALRARAPGVPEPVAITIARALEPRKDDRSPSMTPIIEALERKTPAPSPANEEPPRAKNAPELASASAPPPAPARQTLRRTLAYAAAGLALAAIATTVAVRMRAGANTRPRTGSPLQAPHPACHVDSQRSFAVAADDRVTMLPSGTVVFARAVTRGLRLEREGPDGGMTPAFQHPFFAMFSEPLDDVHLFGITYDGIPAVAVSVPNGGDWGLLFAVGSEGGSGGSRRVSGPVVGTALISVGGKDLVLVAAAETFSGPRGKRPAAVDVYRMGPSGPANIIVEEVAAMAPAIAEHDGKFAVSYATLGGLHFASLDRGLHRVGDVLTVAPQAYKSAVAFAGTIATVFWSGDLGGKRRITKASLMPDGTAFAPPAAALDEVILDQAPLAVPLPDGTWALAWFAPSGETATLRVARVGADGRLTGPSDVARGVPTSGVTANRTDTGIVFQWNEPPGTVRLVRVSCAAPAP